MVRIRIFQYNPHVITHELILTARGAVVVIACVLSIEPSESIVLNTLLSQVTMDDFTKAKEKALYRKKGNIPEGLYL